VKFCTKCAVVQCVNTSSSRSPPLSASRCLGTLQAKWQRITVSSPTFAEKDCDRVRLLNAFRQSDADQLRRQSLRCSSSSSLELSADGPQTAGLVIQPFQIVAESIFVWSMGPNRSVNPHPLNCVLKILLFTYLL